MRFFFVLLLTLNLGVAAFGQGWFGSPPSDSGRDAYIVPQRNVQALVLGPAQVEP